jgi:hypothetical protein
MVAGAAARRRAPPWTFAVVGVVIAATIFVGLGPPGMFLRETVCELGSVAGTYVIWSPGAMVNNPDGGAASFNASVGSWNYTFTSGSLSVGSLAPSPVGRGNGEGNSVPSTGVFADYADFNWTFYHTVNVSRVGASSDPCTQPYVAVRGFPAVNRESLWSTIPIPDNSTDAVEPHVWNGTTGQNSTHGTDCGLRTPGTYVWFDSAFHGNGTAPAGPVRWDLCNASGLKRLDLMGLAQLPVRVVAPLEGGSVSAVGYLEWISEPPPGVFAPTATYVVPGGWVWTLAPVGPVSSAIDPNAPLPGLVAFVRSAC